MKRLATAFTVPVLLLGLAGCSASASAYLTVPAKQVAQGGAKALQKEIGLSTLPPVDCGDKQVELKNGNKLKCTATDPRDNKTYDATITISKVKGANYHIDIQVAKTPNN